MEELVKITCENNEITVLGRDLHEFLESKEDYTSWFKRMLEYCFEENRDFVQIDISSESISSGIDQRFVRPKYNHQLTIEMAKEISMIQRNEKGKQARKYFIECEKKLKENVIKLPKTYKEALLALIESEEKKERLELERDIAIQTKSEIGNKREASAMNKASQLSKEVNKLREEIGFTREYASVKRVQVLTKRKLNWVPLKKYSIDHEIEIKTTPDENYGTVNCYSAEAWFAVYEIDLDNFFK